MHMYIFQVTPDSKCYDLKLIALWTASNIYRIQLYLPSIEFIKISISLKLFSFFDITTFFIIYVDIESMITRIKLTWKRQHINYLKNTSTTCNIKDLSIFPKLSLLFFSFPHYDNINPLLTLSNSQVGPFLPVTKHKAGCVPGSNEHHSCLISLLVDIGRGNWILPNSGIIG